MPELNITTDKQILKIILITVFVFILLLINARLNINFKTSTIPIFKSDDIDNSSNCPKPKCNKCDKTLNKQHQDNSIETNSASNRYTDPKYTLDPIYNKFYW